MIVAEKNRILKILETANIKLSSIISDAFGASGWKIIKDIAKGIRNPEKLAKHKSPNSRADYETFKNALTGRITDHHIFLLQKAISLIEYLKIAILDIEKEQEKILDDYKKEIDLLLTVPGVKKTSAAIILSEIGDDMDQFSNSRRISSWAGVSPGNNESAGKKKVLGQIQETVC